MEDGRAARVLRRVQGADFSAADLPERALVMFSADWCGFCHRFLPHFKRLGDVWLVDVSDEDDPLWDAYGLRVVPTVILFERGQPRRRWAGALSPGDAEAMGAARAA